MVTIKEIAARAGVSTATVSNVIHNKTKRVSPRRIEQIKALLVEMGYYESGEQPSAEVNSPRLAALVINAHKEYKKSVGSEPFYGMMIGMIEACLKEHGYYLVVYVSPDIEEIMTMISQVDPAGIITLTISRNNCTKIANQTKRPVVSIDAYGSGSGVTNSRAANIGLDDYMGGYQMGEHLAGCGYHPIYVCADEQHGVDKIRYEGCLAAVAAYNQKNPGEDIVTRFVALGNRAQERTEKLESFLNHVKKKLDRQRPGIFFLSDSYAYQAIPIIAGLGINLPGQMGVAGFDNISRDIAALFGLTTVHQNVQQKAETAVGRLIRQIGGTEEDLLQGGEILLPVKLVVRKTTAVLCLLDSATN